MIKQMFAKMMMEKMTRSLACQKKNREKSKKELEKEQYTCLSVFV